MDVVEKLGILADAAKYDVACTSSGITRHGKRGELGSAMPAGCCHSFTPDGRCITLLKVLMTNVCVYDCAYCANRRSNDVPRASFTPRELADLTISFYRRNYIEGLFVSSGVAGSPDATTELMVRTLRILREEYRFRGYIHAKAVPGTSSELVDALGHLADRMSVNLELPSHESLALLAPQKDKQRIIAPMRQIRDSMAEDRETRSLVRRRTTYLSQARPARKGRAFVPAGQSTQMIVGASPESDFHILTLSQALYKTLSLKRVFFSAYLPVNDDARLPADGAVQLDREHRLYQADWLLRFYRFDAGELVDPSHPFLDPQLDPKASWAINHLDFFPVEVNTAPLEALLRVPGIGPRGARLIVRARKRSCLREEQLRKLGIAYKRARFFITCGGTYAGTGTPFTPEALRAQLAAPIDGGRHGRRATRTTPGQMSLFGADEGEQLRALATASQAAAREALPSGAGARHGAGANQAAGPEHGRQAEAGRMAGSTPATAAEPAGYARFAADEAFAAGAGRAAMRSACAVSAGRRSADAASGGRVLPDRDAADGTFGWQRAIEQPEQVPA